MNAIGFFMRRLLWQFGIKQERHRWSAVTRETQFLAEAQDLLGKLAWPLCEGIEDLSGEYWQILDLDKRQQEMRDQSERLTSENEAAQEKLYEIEDRYEHQVQAILSRKRELMEKAVVIMNDVEQIKESDSDTRRRFGSLKAKLEVLKRQDGDYAEEIEKTRTMLVKLKESHARDLSEIAARESEVEKLEQAVQRIDDEVASRREQLRSETAELVQEIGRRSKQIAELSAKIGSIDTQKGELSFLIGQYLSNAIDGRDPATEKALNAFRPIVNKIKSLRTSIQYNQRLARRASR
jgi:DNA repair exonuclease SbcCD ATPase subunit